MRLKLKFLILWAVAYVWLMLSVCYSQPTGSASGSALTSQSTASSSSTTISTAVVEPDYSKSRFPFLGVILGDSWATNLENSINPWLKKGLMDPVEDYIKDDVQTFVFRSHPVMRKVQFSSFSVYRERLISLSLIFRPKQAREFYDRLKQRMQDKLKLDFKANRSLGTQWFVGVKDPFVVQLIWRGVSGENDEIILQASYKRLEWSD